MTFTGNAWVDWPALIAFLLVAYSTIWKRGIKPCMRFCREVSETVGLVREIAAEFHHNHGTSVRDVMTRIETKADEAINRAGEAARLASEAQSAAAESQRLIRENVVTIAADLGTIKEQTVASGTTY